MDEQIFPSTTPLTLATRSRLLTPLPELLDWLTQENRHLTQNGDASLARHVRTLRWLVLAELERNPPEATGRGPPTGPVAMPAESLCSVNGRIDVGSAGRWLKINVLKNLTLRPR